jgi:hypothetical protein
MLYLHSLPLSLPLPLSFFGGGSSGDPSAEGSTLGAGSMLALNSPVQRRSFVRTGLIARKVGTSIVRLTEPALTRSPPEEAVYNFGETSAKPHDLQCMNASS